MGPRTPRQPGLSPTHFNRNLFCAIDTETTGLDFTKHEILQLCILPLGPDFKPSKDIRPFELKIKPEHPETIDFEADKINRGLVQACMTDGIERWTAVDFFESWFEGLNLPFKKALVPLGANYLFDRDFIREFMGGPLNYNQFFRSDYRDVQMTALSLNDMADFHSERIPFPKVNLKYLCGCLGVEHANAHDALGDCIATAEVYRRMMRYRDYADPLRPITATEDPNL